MRLPNDPEHWTAWHVDKAIDEAKKLFDKYEKKIDFTWPREKQDDLYRPYQLARQVAVEVARQVECRKEEAESLP